MALARLDAVLPADPPTELLLSLHAGFIGKYGDDPDEYEYAMSEFLRMNGMYWGVAAMDLMGRLNNMDRDKIIEFLVACQDPQSGGFRPVQGHDPHILNTLSAVQVAVTLDCLDQLDTEGVVRYVVARQQEDGSFTGDRFGHTLRLTQRLTLFRWGERDNRFGFCALATLALLGRLDAVDTELAAEFVCRAHTTTLNDCKGLVEFTFYYFISFNPCQPC